jgi:hypothetical protein
MGVPAVTYRAIAVSQRDGSALANSNCRMASIATGIDYHTRGEILSSGWDMRIRQSDQQGGTDSGDAAEAWDSYGQELRIRDGLGWSDALADLEAGRLVHLDVWAEACAGPCLSGTGAYGHTIAVAPEASGSRWLTSDPWCSPPKWTWWEAALLEAGAETWGGMCYSSATAGLRWTGDERALRALMRLAAKRLMSLYRPDAPAVVRPPDTGGSGGRIMFTTTGAAGASSEETDLPINAAAGLVTGIRARISQGVDWFKDANLTQRGGSFSSDADVVFVGSPVSETVEGGSYAVQVQTAAIYADKQVRPTVVYIATADADTYSVPPPTTLDVAEIEAARDEVWLAHLTPPE